MYYIPINCNILQYSFEYLVRGYTNSACCCSLIPGLGLLCFCHGCCTLAYEFAVCAVSEKTVLLGVIRETTRRFCQVTWENYDVRYRTKSLALASRLQKPALTRRNLPLSDRFCRFSQVSAGPFLHLHESAGYCLFLPLLADSCRLSTSALQEPARLCLLLTSSSFSSPRRFFPVLTGSCRFLRLLACLCKSSLPFSLGHVLFSSRTLSHLSHHSILLTGSTAHHASLAATNPNDPSLFAPAGFVRSRPLQLFNI